MENRQTPQIRQIIIEIIDGKDIHIPKNETAGPIEFSSILERLFAYVNTPPKEEDMPKKTVVPETNDSVDEIKDVEVLPVKDVETVSVEEEKTV